MKNNGSKNKPFFGIIPNVYANFTTCILLMISQLTSAESPMCSNTTMFANNSRYETNLNILLRYLSSNATNSNGYYYANSSNGNTDDETIYGHFLCRGDQTPGTCQDCVTLATTALPTIHCPNRKEALIWYNYCLLRYSNKSFFGKLDQTLIASAYNANKVTGNTSRFVELLENMMNKKIAVRAALGKQKKYATDSVNYTSSQRIYGLGQCTPDLSPSDCNICLMTGVGLFMKTQQGMRVLQSSCDVRYETTPFFILSSLDSSPSPLQSAPPQPPQQSPAGDPHDSTIGKKSSAKVIILAIVIPAVTFIVALFVLGTCCVKRKKSKSYDVVETGADFTNVESLQYDLATLKSATNNFSDENKLGEGGFGGVYKGTLSNGQLIAVKRLSMNSSQGLQEFKNEVSLILKLQHRNLVRLLGFCFEGKEKLLVYEYMPNNSLDNLIFDPDKQGLFDWAKRYKTIRGIARGMLYLHHDSQLRIIHRDLKASNVLLDVDMNSKISDFGMARLFGVDQTQSNTSRIVGTYGYMSPEYVMHGQFSIKSDVYSFGVLILEIISGKKNNTFYHSGDAQDLLSYAWKKFRDGKLLEFVDPTIIDSCSNNEVERCMHLGLLCVQESPTDRPTMATVVLTLDSHSVTLPVPKEPGFFIKSRLHSNFSKEISSDESSSKSTRLSVNELTITEPAAR